MYTTDTPPSIIDVQAAVARHYGLSVKQIRSECRERRILYPRILAMTLARRWTQKSLEVIAVQFGGRDHTTIINAVHTTAKRLASGQLHQEVIDAIHANITGTHHWKAKCRLQLEAATAIGDGLRGSGIGVYVHVVAPKCAFPVRLTTPKLAA